MIDILEVNVGDCVYAKLTVQNAPVFAEVVKILEKENAVEIRTDVWGNRIVIAENAYWDEKAAKKGKIVKVQNNYTEWAKEYFRDEETETNDRIDPVYHGKTEEGEHQGEILGDVSVQKRSKRKQKVVRKSSTKRRKIRRDRKSGGKEE